MAAFMLCRISVNCCAVARFVRSNLAHCYMAARILGGILARGGGRDKKGRGRRGGVRGAREVGGGGGGRGGEEGSGEREGGKGGGGR